MLRWCWTWFLVAVATFGVNTLGAGGRASAEADAGGRCVIFFEGNDCTKGRSSCCTDAGKGMRGCWDNDEARSMKLYGPSGTVITVFDHPAGSTSDDYFVFTKGVDDPVCVGSFENAGGILAATPHRWFYSGGNGLDGKVSTFRWSDPRHAPAQR